MAQSAYTRAVLADTPLAFYKLDEASGLPQDSSGNGNHMTALHNVGAGTVSYQETGPFSGASSIHYNGVGSNGDVYHQISVFNTAVDNISLECWIVGTTAGGLAGGPANHTFGVRILTAIRATVNGSFQGTGKLVGGAQDLSFFHCVIVRRAGNWELYINGELYEIAGTTTPSTPTANFVIGSTPSVNGQNTYISNVSFYNTALSATRIQAHYEAAMDISQAPTNSYATEVLLDVPRLYWKCDEVSGTLTNYGSDGTYANGSPATSGTGAITYRNSVPFPGAYGIKCVAGTDRAGFSPGIYNVGISCTVELWFKAYVIADSGYFLDFGGGSLTFATESIGTKIVPGFITLTAGPQNLNTWLYFVATHQSSGSPWIYYLNGEVWLDNAGTADPGTPGASQALFGAIKGTGSPTTEISNIAFYNEALSATRIKKHYDAAMQTKKQNLQILQPTLTLR